MLGVQRKIPITESLFSLSSGGLRPHRAGRLSRTVYRVSQVLWVSIEGVAAGGATSGMVSEKKVSTPLQVVVTGLAAQAAVVTASAAAAVRLAAAVIGLVAAALAARVPVAAEAASAVLGPAAVAVAAAACPRRSSAKAKAR